MSSIRRIIASRSDGRAIRLGFQRALRNMPLRRLTAAPNEPSPISGHSPSSQPRRPPLIALAAAALRRSPALTRPELS